MYKKIKSEFFYQFDVSNNGLYAISIKAICQNGKIFGMFGGEDLRVEIDDIKLREVPAKGKPQYYNIPPAWNGAELKGLSKIVIFIIKLNKGKHAIKFIPKEGAIIDEEPSIKLFEPDKPVLENIQAEDGNRRPWITLVLINLPLDILDVSAICEKRKGDSDDLKLIIDGQTEKNKKSNWWGKNWYWQGRQLEGQEKDARFYAGLRKGIHYVELWADRMPMLKKLNLNIETGQENHEELPEAEKDLRIYTAKGVYGNENYNKYDDDIKKIVYDWNKMFSDDVYPVKEPLDPNLVKAIIYEESRMGYESGGGIDIMQVGNDGDPALLTLNGKLEEYWIREGNEIPLDYEGEANADTPYNSIKWGIRWLYHKAQGVTNDGKRYWRSWNDAVWRYGPNTDEYVDKVWSVYKKGIDKKDNIKLWSFIVLPILLSIIYLVVYFIQGYVFMTYKDIGEENICIGRAWLEIGIMDGLRIKKATLGPIDGLPWSTTNGPLKDTILIDYYDLDNDGRDDILVSAYHSTGSKLKYLYRIGKTKLEEIKFVDYSNSSTGDNSLYADNIRFGPRDNKGRYTFIEETLIPYSNAPDQIWRHYYRFNEEGNIVHSGPEKEDVEESVEIGFLY